MRFRPRVTVRPGCCFIRVIVALVCAGLHQPSASAQSTPNDFCLSSPRSAVLSAQNGGSREYVETIAERPKRVAGRNPDTACAARSKLFVSGSGDAFNLAFMQSPTPERPGNGMKLIDWSPSGKYLLLDLFTYQYEGEGGEHTPLIYDADSGLVYQPDLYHLFKEHFGRECGATASIDGFTSDGLVLLRVIRPVPDPTYEPKMPASCVKQRGFWSLNFKQGGVGFLGDHYEVKKY